MATLKNIFDKCGVALYQNESLDLDHYYQEPYQDEGDEIKAIGKPFGELGIQIFSFPMKYSPINRTDRSYIGVNWTKKSIRAISAILQVTKGVVAAGSDFFYKAFGNTLEEYFELLAMPRELMIAILWSKTSDNYKPIFQKMNSRVALLKIIYNPSSKSGLTSARILIILCLTRI